MILSYIVSKIIWYSALGFLIALVIKLYTNKIGKIPFGYWRSYFIAIVASFCGWLASEITSFVVGFIQGFMRALLKMDLPLFNYIDLALSMVAIYVTWSSVLHKMIKSSEDYRPLVKKQAYLLGLLIIVPLWLLELAILIMQQSQRVLLSI